MVEVLTVQEVALLLKLHPRTVMKMAANGEIPAAKVGRKWRFDRRLIEEWLAVQMGPSRGTTVSVSNLFSPSSLLTQEQTLIVDSGTDATAILTEMASRIDLQKVGMTRDELVMRLKEREAMFSTATDMGVAFPHPRHPISTLEVPILTLAVAADGVDFKAPDGTKTRIFVLICSPDDRSHVHLLAMLARIFREEGVVEQICSCQTPEEVLDTFRRAENQILAVHTSIRRSIR